MGKRTLDKSSRTGRRRRINADSGRAMGKRATLDIEFRAAGKSLRLRMNVASGVVNIPYSKALRRRVLVRFVSASGELQADKIINRLFRAAWDAQDELFSTASMRELVKGMMEGITRDQLTKEQWEHLVDQIDILSALRLPTAQSGFSLAGRVMQHPTSVAEAYFANPRSTASLHSQLDTARRSYVIRAIKEAIDAKLGAVQLIKAIGRAAIEFTLNYFTSPITASNVKPYSRLASASVYDSRLMAQVQEREQLKLIYERLGGTLRSPARPETAAERLERTWIGPPNNTDSVPVVSPSPRRLISLANNADAAVISDSVPVVSPGPSQLSLANNADAAVISNSVPVVSPSPSQLSRANNADAAVISNSAPVDSPSLSQLSLANNADAAVISTVKSRAEQSGRQLRKRAIVDLST